MFCNLLFNLCYIFLKLNLPKNKGKINLEFKDTFNLKEFLHIHKSQRV